MLNIGDENYIRCVNCWMLHANNKSILDHWNNGGCLFYCSICGKSFHDNIKNLSAHFLSEHGIKQRVPAKPRPGPKSKSQARLEPRVEAKPDVRPDAKPEARPEAKQNGKPEPKADESPQNIFPCSRCSRSFKSQKALNCHTTVFHDKPEAEAAAKSGKPIVKDKKRINPMVLATANQNASRAKQPSPQSCTQQFKDVTMKKISTPTNDKSSYSVRKKSPDDIQVKKPDTVPTLIIRRTPKGNQKASESTVPECLDEQNNVLATSVRRPQQQQLNNVVITKLKPKPPPHRNVFTTIKSPQNHLFPTSRSQNPTLTTQTPNKNHSITQISSPATNAYSSFIKSEPVEDISSSFDPFSFDLNGSSGPIPLEPVEWISTELNQYDSMPRLKVKKLTDLQEQPQRSSLDSHNNTMTSYNATFNNQFIANKDYSDLQIQNVQQSYQAPAEPLYTYNTNYAYTDPNAPNLNVSVQQDPSTMYLPNSYDIQCIPPINQTHQPPPITQPTEYLVQTSTQHGLPDYGY